MGEVQRKKLKAAISADDPAFQKKVFTQAFEQTCKAIEAYPDNPVRALLTSYSGRNAALDQVIQVHAALNNAECREGCASCCHQMVLCAPFEAFVIARHLLDTKTSVEIEKLKTDLRALALLPLDPDTRHGNPCPLLQNNRCTIYEQRPSVCRTMLSASRAACETCLTSKGPCVIPYVAVPLQIDAMMTLALEYGLTTRLNLCTDRVELCRALLIALSEFDNALTTWGQGGDPFSDCHARPPGSPPNREILENAAKRLGVK